jgi:hypothetical protein
VARLPRRDAGQLCADHGLGFGVCPALMGPVITKFARMALEAAVMAVLAGLLTMLLTRA